MIRRSFDAAFLNDIANRPEVLPFLGWDKPEALDLAPLISNSANITIEAQHGGWVLVRQAEGVYEMHTIFAKEGRGKSFFGAAREFLRYAFTKSDCAEILTKCPDDNPGARWAAGAFGFRERFRREKAWGPDLAVGISYRAFTIDDWFIRDPEALKAGREFHAALEAAKIAKDSDLPVHPDDEAHDRAAGAAFLMISEGQTMKGVAFYNRWASFAGYGLITPVGPGLVDIQDGIVAVQGGRAEVLSLR